MHYKLTITALVLYSSPQGGPRDIHFTTKAHLLPKH